MRLIFTFLFVFALDSRAAETLSGRWEGSVQIPERELKLIVDLAQQDGSAWTGSVIIPGMDIKGTPLTDIAVKNLEVSFAIKSGRAFQANCKGVLNSKDELAGDFVLAGNTARFVLKKTGLPQVESLPRSTTVARELEGAWKGAYEMLGYPRHVTLTLTNREAGGATAEFVVVGKKTNNLPVDLVTQEGNLLTIDSHETGLGYEGRFDKASGEIKGIFSQGPLEIPLVLRRAK